MLTVIAVISVLAAVALPNMKGWNQAGLRRGAVSGIMNTLDRARVMALSDGRATYVVFATKTGSGTQVNPALWGRAYAIFQDGDNITFKPVQRTPWTYLPTTMSFKVNGAINTVSNRPLDASIDPQFPLTTVAGSGSATLPYLKYDSTGMVDQQDTNYLRILLFPGSIDANGNEVLLQNNGATTSLYEEIDVNPATGRARYVDNPADNLSATPAPIPVS